MSPVTPVEDPLIDTAELVRLLAAHPAPAVLDVRWRLTGPPAIDDYRHGHLPGAVFIDLDRDLAGPPGRGGRHPLPAAGDFERVMRWAGVTADRLVVVYDDADSTAAARAWWTLRYFGHERVRVLDGGHRAWLAAGLPVTTDDPEVPVGDFVARPGSVPILDADAAAALAGSGDGLLLDARAAERFRGEVEPIDPVAGHIPGAISAPTLDNVGSGGRFRSAAELRERFAGLGVRPTATATATSTGTGTGTGTATGTGTGTGTGTAIGSEGIAVGAYCGSGVTAAHEVLALAVAGVPAALYVGSWSEWITDPARPVATTTA